MKIGIIGAGRLGTSLARLSLNGGHEVAIANSRGPESLELSTKVLIPGARPAELTEVVRDTDFVILALPFHQAIQLDKTLFDGKLVIDATNYWAPVEGTIEVLDASELSSSEYIQQYFDTARIVKSLNHIAYNELEEHTGTGRVVLVASDDDDAKQRVVHYIESLGFDASNGGTLAEGLHFQPDTQLFNTRFTRDQLDS